MDANTLYALLDKDDDGYIDSADSVTVSQGAIVGLVGGSGKPDSVYESECGGTGYDDAYCPHLHFELLRLDGTADSDWFEKDAADGCSGDDIESGAFGYCGWSPSRRMLPLLDPERHLEPLPASFVPRDPGRQSAITTANADRRVFELLAVSPRDVGTGATATLSTAFWRPAFYSRYDVPGRHSRSSVDGTRPGVERYYTVDWCSQGQIRFPTAAPEGESPGEFGRLEQTIHLPLGKRCGVSLYTASPTYPPSDQALELGPFLDRDQVNLSDPRVQFELFGAPQSIPRELTGHEFHFYLLSLQSGWTYRLCVDLNDDGDCTDTGANRPQNPARGVVIKRWSSDGEVVVRANGEPDSRDGEADLSWTATQSGQYVLSMRGGYLCGDSEPCGGTYTLFYTATPPPDCSNLDSFARGASEAAAVCVPLVPGNLRVRDVTDESATLHWDAAVGATGYRVRRDDSMADATPNPLARTTRSYTFSGLTANTAHTLRVKAVRDQLQSAIWAELTLLVPPTLHDASAGGDAIGLSWGEVGRAAEYEVERAEAGGDCVDDEAETPDAMFSHEFPIPEGERGLRHKLCVRGTNAEGPSAWASTLTWTKLPAPRDVRASRPTANATEVAWSGVDHASKYEVKAVTGASCAGNEAPTTVDAPMTSATLTLSQTQSESRFCVRAVQTIQRADGPGEVTRRSDWSIDGADPLALSNFSTDAQYCVLSTTGAVPISWQVTGGQAPYSAAAEQFQQPGGSVDLDCPAALGAQTLALTISDSSDPVQQVSGSVTVTVVAPLAFSLTETSLGCVIGGTVEVEWSLSGGSESYTLSASGQADLTVSAGDGSRQYDCPATAGAHEWILTATDRQVPDLSTSQTLSLTATRPRPSCTEPRPAVPPASETETIAGTPYWEVGDHEAVKKQSTTTRTRTRSVSWLGSPECRWHAGAWSEWQSTTVTATLLTLPRPPDRTQDDETPGGTTWRVGDARACKWQEYSIQPQRNRAVFSEANEAWEFHESGWEDVGPPRTEWRGPLICLDRPADRIRDLESLSGDPYSILSGDTACEWQDYTIPPQRNRAVFSEANEAWEFRESGWTDDGQPTSDSRRTQKPCMIKPGASFEDREVRVSSWTAWVQEGDGLVICWLQQYFYERYVIETWITTHSWTGSSWTPTTSLFHTSDEQTRRTPIVGPVPISCIGRSESEHVLLAGDYEYRWGERQVRFTVPADAQVDLDWRVLPSGVRAAVLTDDGEGEVLAYPGAEDDVAGERESDPRSAVLQAIASSIESGDAAALPQRASSAEVCSVAAPGAGAAGVDLDTDRCLTVPAGGRVRLSLAGNQLEFSLSADRHWIVARLMSVGDGADAIALFDVATTSSLLLDPGSGAETERTLGPDAPASLGRLFDDIVDSVSVSPSGS